jgi:hypothetical protein
VIPPRKLVRGCALAMALVLPSFLVFGNAGALSARETDATLPESALAAYRAMAATQSRNYDRAQDISPRQMVRLLEMSERTGANLGRALATGEFESAHTWNNFVRPPGSAGRLGSATGVWQFQPATFHAIVKRYGKQLLAASEADVALDRKHLDLGEGPFDDAEVRRLIEETVDGSRGVDDEQLQLLRHNFTVLAFAKHFLSVDSGASTPEEDALLHLLGAGQARRVLALARGRTRNTLCVKPVKGQPPRLNRRRAATGDAVSMTRARAMPQVVTGITPRSALYAPQVGPLVSSEWGMPADSPVVTHNPGMFYRDGKGQTRPYTWAEFMKHFARRVKAKRQPALVRAKYGVGFELSGGDVTERAFNPNKEAKVAEYDYSNVGAVHVPEALLLGPLSREEARWYKQRLAELVSRGEDRPTETLPPEALSALHHLRMLPLNLQGARTSSPEVRRALHDFRRKVGKDEPDDPAHSDLLMPAERVALQIYDQRLARYAALQAIQQDSLSHAPDLERIREMPDRHQRFAAYYIAELQRALGAQGLLKQPKKKTVWRDKKGRKRVKYKTLPFAGKVDKKTVTAFSAFQVRNGLRKTEGVLDSASLRLLGLASMGCEIFLPAVGPQCVINRTTNPASMCELPAENKPCLQSEFGPIEQRSGQSLFAAIVEIDCAGPPPADPDALYCATGQ